MKKWMNTLFLGSCFLAALLIEGYGFIVLKGDLITSLGLGIVVLITGYLFMDSVRSGLKKNNEEIKFYLEKFLSQDAEKWDERYTELLNLQKASYTATKKSTDIASKKFEDVLFKIETLENINAKSQQKILALQKKTMEGQKKALNLEINYSNENTKQILEQLQKDNYSDMDLQLSKIVELLEDNSLLIKEGLNRIEKLEKSALSIQQPVQGIKTNDSAYDDFDSLNSNTNNNNYNEINSYDDTDNFVITNNSSINVEDEASYDIEFNIEKTADISNLNSFIDSSYDNHIGDETLVNSNGNFEEIDENYQNQALDFNNTSSNTFDITNEGFNLELDNEDYLDQELNKIQNASEADLSYEEEPESEATNIIDNLDTMESIDTTEEPIVVPLYDDPNKALTADEIAALFASFGQ